MLPFWLDPAHSCGLFGTSSGHYNWFRVGCCHNSCWFCLLFCRVCGCTWLYQRCTSLWLLGKAAFTSKVLILKSEVKWLSVFWDVYVFATELQTGLPPQIKQKKFSLVRTSAGHSIPS